MWVRHKTFWIVVGVLLALLMLANVLLITLAGGDSGIEIGPIEPSK